MDQAKQEALAQRIRDAMHELNEVLGISTVTCLNCKYFNEKAELCKKVMTRPPARVIAFGCPTFALITFPDAVVKEREPGEDDDIPF